LEVVDLYTHVFRDDPAELRDELTWREPISRRERERAIAIGLGLRYEHVTVDAHNLESAGGDVPSDGLFGDALGARHMSDGEKCRHALRPPESAVRLPEKKEIGGAAPRRARGDQPLPPAAF
jgi:hypothetical protein